MTIKDIYINTKEKIGEEEARIIITHFLSLNQNEIYTKSNLIVDIDKIDVINNAINKRLNHIPLQYILGQWPFKNLNFTIGEGVLIPRDDTEVLVDVADKIIKENHLTKCIDLCAGSGIIGITLKNQNPNTNFTLVEKSSLAYSYLLTNIKNTKIEVNPICEDLNTYADKLSDNSLELIVSNPPYIKTSELNTLQYEIKYEPSMALDGGKDGLDFYVSIINKYSCKLNLNGYICLEIGEDQFIAVSSLLKNNNYKNIKCFKDIQNLDRVIIAQKCN